MSREYEVAMMAFQRHLHSTAEGFLRLDVEDGREIGITDPIIFADLKRSLDETNRKIELGQIDPQSIVPYNS